MEKGYIEIDGCKLRYQIEGSGPDVLVIGSAIFYPRSFSQELRKHFRLIFIDWRGFGEIESTKEITFDTLLDDIEFVRKKLGIKNCVVMGHSAHAILTLEYAKKYPEAVSHVVMIGISPNLHPEMAALAQRYWEETASVERKAALEKSQQKFSEGDQSKLSPSERFVAWYVSRDPQAWYDYSFNSAWLWEGVYPNMPLFDFLYGVVLRDIDITKGLENFKKPVFLALGRYDYIVAPSSSWDPIRAKFHDLTLRVFEHSGHSPQFEEASLFDKELLNWHNQ